MAAGRGAASTLTKSEVSAGADTGHAGAQAAHRWWQPPCHVIRCFHLHKGLLCPDGARSEWVVPMERVCCVGWWTRSLRGTQECRDGFKMQEFCDIA